MREWIVTNNLGGYASLTHSNTNTRKFHGLLVASLNPPTERWIFVSNVEEIIKIKDKTYKLKDIREKFNFDILPSINYEIDGIKIKKTIFLQHGKNTSIMKYNIITDKALEIIHKPLINSRHFYDVTKHKSLQFNQDIMENGISIRPSNIDKSIKIILLNSKYMRKENWIEFQYDKDKERNDSYIDNNFYPGEFHKKIKKSIEYFLLFSIENKIEKDISKIFNAEIKRKQNLFNKTGLSIKFKKLILSSDNFIVNKRSSKSVIAGYHWFGDWGRDTLISLPGLTLVTGRFIIAKEILLGLKEFCKDGLIPNAFMDRNSKAVYNTVDASLWYIDRVYQYLKYTNDRQLLTNIWYTMKSIIDSYINGTKYEIIMDDDFLISHKPGITWMDVKIDDYYPTPRDRKAVEIQALWYNALRIMSVLARKIGQHDDYYHLSEKVKDSFNSQYKQQYDVIDKKDLSFRPNQIFLVSLDYSMINEKLQEKIVKEIQESLVTIFGLRTLSSNDSRYKGKYIGEHNRDIAYHNGTVWPWLLGPFIKSYVKINKKESIWRKYAFEKFLKPMIKIYGKNWDGSIYEIFDAEKPYAPRGCISQAWSVAEILRTWVEDIENIPPLYERIFTSHEICI